MVLTAGGAGEQILLQLLVDLVQVIAGKPPPPLRGRLRCGRRQQLRRVASLLPAAWRRGGRLARRRQRARQHPLPELLTNHLQALGTGELSVQ